MKKNRLFKSNQAGLSLISLIVVAVLLALAALIVAQIVPTAVEYRAVKYAVKKAALEGKTEDQARASFTKSAQIDDISSIAAKDLKITQEGGKLVINFAYQREIHLTGPAWLTLKYEGSSR